MYEDMTDYGYTPEEERENERRRIKWDALLDSIVDYPEYEIPHGFDILGDDCPKAYDLVDEDGGSF